MNRTYTPPDWDMVPDDIIWSRNYANFANIRRFLQNVEGRIYAVRSHDIAIFIDGACVGGGTYHAQAGVGVYFGPGSRYNVSKQLDDNPMTNQRAELNAAIVALERVYDLIACGLTTDIVLLITDSTYVVQGITDLVYKWRDKGWKNRRGVEVANREDFERLDDLIDILEDENVFVKFWLVPKEYNGDADELANNVLDL
jgi:ribonuclease HI